MPVPKQTPCVPRESRLDPSEKAVNAGTSSADPTIGTAGSDDGPIARQQQREDTWRKKLSRSTTWWDSASAALGDVAAKADIHLGKATRAQAASEGSLRTLVRGRNHAKAELRSLDSWRDDQIDQFLHGGRGSSSRRNESVQQLTLSSQLSPNHFERRYGARRHALPPLSVQARDTLARSSAMARQREERNTQARANAFAGIGATVS